VNARRLLLVVAAVLLGAGTVGWPATAGADAPVRYGWWYEANASLPVPPPAPPQVPSDGMFVENGFNGPAALSAVTFAVPDGSAVGALVLHIAGTPTITQPPVACALDPGSASYKAAEEGSWSDRPTADCSQVKVTGTVDAAKTTVTFASGSLLHDGALSAVIEAGGPADEVAFSKPGSDALAVTPPPAAAADDTGAAVAFAPAGADVSNSGTSSTPGDSSASLPSIADTSGGSTLPAATDTASTPTAASGTTTGAAPTSSVATGVSGALKGASHGWRQHIAQAVGVLAVVGLLIAWSEGYGLLGGKIDSLAARRDSSS